MSSAHDSTTSQGTAAATAQDGDGAAGRDGDRLEALRNVGERSGGGDGDPVVILGGGPAGLTAGYLLSKRGRKVIVLESQEQIGGLAKTVVRDGYRFDLGGHRFFTKVKEVDRLCH